MMQSLKAILAGCLFVIVVMLLLQLAYIFVAVGYNSLARSYPLLHTISGAFRYLVGLPLFMAIMFGGGYITADVAGKKIMAHCLAVGLITASAMIVPTLAQANLTLSGGVVFVLAIMATAAGGRYWQRNPQALVPEQ